jgi:hypothetical protein
MSSRMSGLYLLRVNFEGQAEVVTPSIELGYSIQQDHTLALLTLNLCI